MADTEAEPVQAKTVNYWLLPEMAREFEQDIVRDLRRGQTVVIRWVFQGITDRR